jgi:glycosyltransferase involved in cell wall biosynthesis
MTDPMPEVSVLVPTRGRWPLLRETLESALAQIGVRIEIVVVDDGSADETAARLAEANEPRIRVHRHEGRYGEAASRNLALDLARGEWVAFLDDDDLWAPDNLRVKLELLRASSADFAYSRVVMIDERNTPQYVFDLPETGTILPRLLEASVIPGGPSNLVTRASLVREVGGFDERFARVADWDLFIRLAAAGRAVASERVLVAYRRHSANTSGDGDADALAELRVMAGKHADLSRRHGTQFDMARVVRWTRTERRRRLVSRARRAGEEGRHTSSAALFALSAARYRRRDDLRHALRVIARRRLDGQLVQPSPGSASSARLERPPWLTERCPGTDPEPGSGAETKPAIEIPR